MYFLNYTDLGSVMAFLILQDGVTYMSLNLREFFGQIQQSRVNIQRVFEMLDQDIESDLASAVEEIDLIPNDLIKCENVTFQYDVQQTMALNNISCQIPSEKVTVIIGRSGIGKSTLVKLLLGFYRLHAGKIYIGDNEYSNLKLKSIRDHYSYVPQSAHLFYDSIENNIRCGNEDVSFDEVVATAKFAKAHNFIMGKPDGYQTMVQEHGTNFSGGEKQRIAIARAILKNAPVIILDEATSAIDSKNESYIHNYMKSQAENGKTILVIAHRESALRFSEHTIRIE